MSEALRELAGIIELKQPDAVQSSAVALGELVVVSIEARAFCGMTTTFLKRDCLERYCLELEHPRVKGALD